MLLFQRRQRFISKSADIYSEGGSTHMTKAAKNQLMNLSSDTKTLINQGVYSLYSLAASSAPAGAKYVLYTSKRSFLLNETGKIVSEETAI